MYNVTHLPLKGALLVELPMSKDARGSFVKAFHAPTYLNLGIFFELRESYYSLSAKGVIRGMHFQVPPHQHSKIVFCPRGAILDVILDLRTSSPTYGQCFSTELTEANHTALFIPQGFAHGFKSLTDDAMTYYLVSTEYSMEHDKGIRYDTIGFDWGAGAPEMSARDLQFPGLGDFASPFL